MNWEKVEIGKVSKVISGFAFKSKDFQPTGTPVIKIKNIKDENIVLDESDCVDSAIEVPIRFHLSKGDILISLTGSHITLPSSVVGRVAKYRHETNSYLNQRAGKFINFDNEKCFKDYLFYFLLQKETLTKIANKAQGAANQANISPSDVEGVEINLPPLPTQRKIASILSAYDDLIENNLKRIKLLEEKASLMYKLMQKELSDAENVNLYDFANIQMGFAFKAEAFNEEGEGIPIIRIRDIPSQMTKSYTTQEVDNQYWVEKGDLLIGMDGEFHMNEWLGQRGYLVQRVCRLRAKNELNQSYLWQALKEPIHYYETTISGATVAHLGKKHLEEIFIAQPKDSMKNELEEMNTMRKLKIILAEQNTKLREARDILLPKLMSGQIEVS
ncbi:MAG: restriction endonuclease subunit S [Spirosomataceae bacterium]|jgi:type I restriction enzyme S subunit